MSKTFKPPGQCPCCGEWVPRKAVACDCCGACDLSGWKGDAEIYDGLDLPEDDFNYDEFIANEFGESRPKAERMSQLWWWVAVVLLGVMGWGLFSTLWR